jgi:hypothetical protein
MPTNRWRKVEIPELKSKGAKGRKEASLAAALDARCRV